MSSSSLRTFLACLAIAASAAACGAGQSDTQQREANPTIPRQDIGAGGTIGPAPQDMPGGGRGSFSSAKGKP